MKIKFIVFTLIILIFGLTGCVGIKNESNSIIKNDKNITSLKIHNLKGELKEVKNKSDINQVVKLINSVKIVKSNVEVKDGIGYGVEIIYSDGKKENISFSDTLMLHDGKYYEINKNIVNDLKNIYIKI